MDQNSLEIRAFNLRRSKDLGRAGWPLRFRHLSHSKSFIREFDDGDDGNDDGNDDGDDDGDDDDYDADINIQGSYKNDSKLAINRLNMITYRHCEWIVGDKHVCINITHGKLREEI